MTKVRVLESGYYLCTREVGEEFDVPEDFGKIPAWLEEVKPVKGEEKTEKK